MKLRLFNSLDYKTEEFVPLEEGKVSIYVCGPTVYASPHVGNFRPPVVFDTLRRLLIAMGYDVTYVSNYTDVDDKIINEAMRLGIAESELTAKVIAEYGEISEKMGIMEPDHTPTPTRYMGKIISYISDLVEKGFAYEAGGDVYFRVRMVPGYGRLSGNSIENLEQGARIEVNSNKEDPLDFALWKKTETGIKWDSPWGKGRPGWHSECCVMIDSIFRDQNGYIDIHGGGFDLKFPHHENEIAQSYAHNGNLLARYFVHNGFVNMGKEKMSKSLGNVMAAKDVVARYGGEAFRLSLISTHYRAPVAFGEEALGEALTKVNSLNATYRRASLKLQLGGRDPYKQVKDTESPFIAALCDDLNTPNALSALYEEAKQINVILRSRAFNLEKLAQNFACFSLHASILGLCLDKPLLCEEDKALLEEYNSARSAKDFEKSDALRPRLLERGLI